MVAVGSNASTAVLRAKLADHRGADIRPTRVVVSGIALGYSAHVAARGYIPAAPFLSPGSVTVVSAFWLDEDQLTALDSTEPNYHRLTVTTTSHPLREADDRDFGDRRITGVVDTETCPRETTFPPLHSSPVPQFALYASRHGVLTDRRSTPLTFGTQRTALMHLSSFLDDRSLAGEPATVCADLGRSRSRAAALTRRIHESGLCRDDGFAHVHSEGGSR